MEPLDRRTLLRMLAATGAAVGAGALGTAPAFGTEQAAPTISSCATWGARAATETITVLNSRPTKILVHHTDTPNSTDYSQAHAFSLSRSIQDHHIDDNHWIDTGQHFTNSRGGYVTEGRHQSLAALRDGHKMVRAAHCPGQNDIAIGIENEGNYMSTQPPAKLYSSLVSLCAYICTQYDIKPTAIYGHRDYYNTDCPGDVLYKMLPQLRKDVAAKL
ncbi:peptidoglycan recognition protein family protein [Kutzneria albida]|uniref:N-acetylmuramoyl-L-alanine amidase family 2 protein n=1 Tax=Kutzneria albida DSM 43870 TaxID=1449976 RepID=W5W849_9PSEU|nr:peptidoglycan recognition family protein [Kutzneria albida]AHH96691.1 N-acetylmuramoyl-L-alanine amidase family 2 protein [Kutzneria albida DSM 43870]